MDNLQPVTSSKLTLLPREQFTKGKVSFGGVVAVLTATMGDAAFLLLAKKPHEGLLILSVSLGIGALTGYLVN